MRYLDGLLALDGVFVLVTLAEWSNRSFGCVAESRMFDSLVSLDPLKCSLLKNGSKPTQTKDCNMLLHFVFMKSKQCEKTGIS